MSFKKSLLAATACVLLAVTVMGCDSPEEKEAKYIKRGNELYEQGDYVKARLEYKNAAKLKPTDAEPFYRLAMVDESTGDLRNAFIGFSAAEQQNPGFHPAALKVAQYYMAAEMHEDALRRIDMVLAEDKNNSEAHALLAAMKLKEKKLEEAEAEARKALAIDGSNVTAFSVLAGVYSAKDDVEKAAAVLNEGIAKNPKNLALPMLRVVLYEKQRDLTKVAEAYEALFKLKPEEIQLRVSLANEYIGAGKIDEAEASLRKGVSDLPESWEMKRRLAVFLGEHRSLAEAEKEIRQIMQAYPRDDRPYFWLADLYANHEATDKATGLLNQIVERGGYDIPALNARTLLARISIKHGDASLAQRLVSIVLDKKPDNRDALIIRAGMSFDDGAYQSAVSDLRTVLRDSPKDKEALRMLGEALIFQGRMDLAADTMKTLVDVDPADKIANVRLAQVLHLSGDTSHALELLSFIAKTDPSYALAWESAARVAIDAKDWLSAQHSIKALDAIDGQHKTAAFLEGNMKAAGGKQDEAIAKYVEAIGDDPSSPIAEHAMLAMVDLYLGQGKAETAANYLGTLKSTAPLVDMLLGRCYSALDRTKEGADAFDRAIAAGIGLQDAYIGRADLYVKDKHYDQAVDVLKKGGEIASRDFRAPLMAAELLQHLGRYKDALVIYESVLDKNPEVAIAANNMADIISDHMFNDPAALEKARQAADRFSNSGEPLLIDTLAWVYFRMGKFDLAQTLADRVQQLGKELSPQVYYHYGMILKENGKAQAAKEALTKATVDGASYYGLDQAKAALAEYK